MGLIADMLARRKRKKKGGKGNEYAESTMRPGPTAGPFVTNRTQALRETLRRGLKGTGA